MMISYSKCVESKYNRVNFIVNQLEKMRKYINNDIAITMYKQLILPLFDYADCMVKSAHKKNKKKREIREIAIKDSEICRK